MRALEAITVLDKKPDITLLSHLTDLAATQGANLALVGQAAQLTYQELVERANRYSQWALNQKLNAGETVCLMMPNCPDYVAIWLGIAQTGCVVALINTNLTGESLLHSVKAAGASQIIVAAAFLHTMSEIADKLPMAAHVWVHGADASVLLPGIDTEILKYCNVLVEIPEARKPKAQDTALLIYTSGTTGWPKAAKVTHGRLVEWSFWFAGMMDAQPSDRLYNCLPMYHSTGGVVAVGAMLVRGGSVLIRERFSARRFWDDIVDGECTIFQYIGELCRYLLNHDVSPRETVHSLRLCVGNGLRRDVWEGFQSRFNIPKILEFYAATESNVSLYNCEGRPGAVGRVPAFLAHRFPIALIKCDTETGEILRDEHGFCLASGMDETGEAIGKILNTAQSQFDGYTERAASEAKVLRNVFKDGDCWFRTGDLMQKDKAGFYYFVDRVGDTFRWKGENISTTEVAAVAGSYHGVIEAVVFGVAVPGNEGRAGMAAITINDKFYLPEFQSHMTANLPEHARPLFVRLCQSIELTGTFKLKKDKLLHEGIAIPPGPDIVWFFDRLRGKFVECDERLTNLIMTGGLIYL